MTKNLSTKQIEKYSRQIVLKNVGIIGQKKILVSSVLVVGAGGLGCPVIDYLSRAGVGLIGIIDYDKVDASNIHRQSIYTYKDIGKYKIEVLKRKLKDINPDVKTKIFKSKITNKNANKILKQFDIIVDGSDNFKTKFLLNQFARKLKKAFIVGAISRYNGHVFSFNFKRNNEVKFIEKEIFVKPIDYYYTNSIARSSKVMSDCRKISKKFLYTGIEKGS